MTLKLYLLLGGAVALLTLGAFGGWKVASWRTGAEIAHLRASLAACQFTVGDYAEAAKTWAEAFDKMEKAAADQALRLKDAEERAAHVRTVYRDRIVEVLGDAPPLDSSCPDAVAWAKLKYREIRP